MAKAIVVYYSRSGNTKEMAEIIAKAMNDADLKTDCKSVDKVKADDLPDYDAIVFGSPTYYGQTAGPIKRLVDDLVSRHGALDGTRRYRRRNGQGLAPNRDTPASGVPADGSECLPERAQSLGTSICRLSQLRPARGAGTFVHSQPA